MNAPVTLYREVDALGGTPCDEYERGYNRAIFEVLKILGKRGFSEQADAAPELQSPMAALATLKASMANDPEYAWSWHCNLAMPIMDALGETHPDVDHEAANVAAAHLMQHMFDCDITTHPHYDYEKSAAQSYAEFRIAQDVAEDAEINALRAHVPARQGQGK